MRSPPPAAAAAFAGSAAVRAFAYGVSADAQSSTRTPPSLARAPRRASASTSRTNLWGSCTWCVDEAGVAPSQLQGDNSAVYFGRSACVTRGNRVS